ncbi:Ankyrin repeats (3 copies) [Popillia japonica]|uniref:Ankyrin repeats (3 copies) n=1 Tax=Popillia japonica TaxID=7064 RepID=A0AAW1IT31_POPJA
MIDREKRSPLLLAASRAGWRSVHCLIRLGADIYMKDVNRRNVLHLVVMNGGRLEEFANEVSKAKSQTNLLQLLNEKDITGCSPLHYASREGHVRSLENLIRLGACINLKNNNNESPLHFAARYGRYNTVRQLLDSEKGTFIINESDGEGLTPLHIASQQGHTRVVQLLLNRGALLHRDHNGRNPLHLAAMNGYTQTIELLLSVHSHLLDQVDKDGNTALHLATMENKPNAIVLLLSMNCKLLYNSKGMSAIDYAIYYKFPEAALAMVTHEDRAQEIMTLKSQKHPCVTLALIASMPKVFEAIQDNCITKANCKKDSKSFYIKYSFSCLECPQFYADMDEKTGEALTIGCPIPLPALNAMVSHGRVELLAHPLSQKYLQMKWNSYGKYFHLANVLFYSIFLGFVTYFSSFELIANEECKTDFNTSEDMDNDTNNFDTISPTIQYTQSLTSTNSTMIFISAIVIISYCSLNTIKEFIQMYQQKFFYFLDPINLVSWLLYVSVIIMLLPVFIKGNCSVQVSFASIAVFLCWFNLLLLLQRFDQVGIYVVMFLEILQTLIKVLMVFSILIIAFGLAFYILLSKGNHKPFENIPLSLMRTFSMMLGEIDFVNTYVTHTGTQLHFPIPAYIILILFMVLMPILLMNLLIGLAVGDIESVRRNAQLKRLAMQVILHSELERKLPRMLLQKVTRCEIIEYPNDTKCKMGILDSILRKWFGNPFTDDGLDMIMESGEDYLVSELEKTKRKLRDISSVLETQQQFLRLIVQKMEIKTEADDVDEGISPNELNPLLGHASYVILASNSMNFLSYCKTFKSKAAKHLLSGNSALVNKKHASSKVVFISSTAVGSYVLADNVQGETFMGSYVLADNVQGETFSSYILASLRFLRSLKIGITISLDYYFSTMGLNEDLENYKSMMSLIHKRAATRIMNGCLVNGGTYIKLGQGLVSLSHILPVEYIEILSRLQDQCLHRDISELYQIIEEDFNNKASNIFKSIDEKPIAAASLAQVFKAEMQNGDKVAIKVQYIDLQSRFVSDVATIDFLLRIIGFMHPSFNFDWVLKDLSSSLKEELDFRKEAKNSERCAEDLKGHSYIYVPKIYSDYCSSRILVTEFIDAIKVNDIEALKQAGLSLYEIDLKIFKAFAHQIFKTGFVHADPHPGNVLVRRKNNAVEIVLLDHGLYQEVEYSTRIALSGMWRAIVFQNYKDMKFYATVLGVEDCEILAEILTQRPVRMQGFKLTSRITEEQMQYMTEAARDRFEKTMHVLKIMPRSLLLVVRNLNTIRSITHDHGDPIDRYAVLARCANISENSYTFMGMIRNITMNWYFEFRLLTEWLWLWWIKMYLCTLRRLGRSPDISNLTAAFS